MIRNLFKSLLRSFGSVAPQQSRALLRVFTWNSSYYLRIAGALNVTTDLGGVVPTGPLRNFRFEGLLHQELDPLLRNLMEPHLSSLLSELELSGKAVIDVGASYGYYTALLARCVGEQGKVYAFEPDILSLGRLVHNMKINGIINAIYLPYALSKEIRADVWQIDLLQPWNNHILGREHGVAVLGELQRPIISIPIDLLLDTLPVANIGLIKIDVEGAEADVLRGGRSLFAQARPLAIIELHSAEITDQVFDLLTSYSYAWETIEFKGESRHHIFAFPQETHDKYAALLARYTVSR